MGQSPLTSFQPFSSQRAPPRSWRFSLLQNIFLGFQASAHFEQEARAAGPMATTPGARVSAPAAGAAAAETEASVARTTAGVTPSRFAR